MTATDARGLETTADSSEARDAVDSFCAELLRMGPDADRILVAAEAHPECPLVQVDAALFMLYGCTQETTRASEALLERARKSARLPREHAWNEVVALWQRGDFEAVQDRCEAISREWPRDLVAVKVAEFQYYLTGQYWTAARFLKHAERIADANDDSPHFASMHAFALELSERPDEAERLAQDAIDREAHNPWGHHALAHVHSRRAEPERGVAAMREFSKSWDDAGSAIRSHNFWHLAVLHIDRLETETALSLHASGVFGCDREFSGIQLDAISLLWRIEMAGIEVTDAWAGVTEATLALAGDFPMPYAAAHHAYLFARTGEEAALEATLAAARRQAETTLPARREVWARGGIDLVEGCAAFGQGDATRAVQCLETHIERVGASGGSDAQIDLFHQTFLSALIESGQLQRADRLIRHRTAGRTATPLENSWLERL